MEARRRWPIRRHKHRLAMETYRGEVAATFTSCIVGKRELFVSENTVAIFRQALRCASDYHQCQVLIYCSMPDHLHLALRGTTASSDLWKTMTLFKQTTGYWLAHHLPGVKWQKDFFDHVLRGEDEVLKHLRYVAENPVRRGLAKEWHAYPFTGSDTLDLRAVFWEGPDPA